MVVADRVAFNPYGDFFFVYTTRLRLLVCSSVPLVPCASACELRNVLLTLKQQGDIKADIVLSRVHSGLFNERLESIRNERYQPPPP